MTDDLQNLAERISACRHCTDCFSATKTRHEPNPIFQISATAKLCIAGQAPGLRAHASGRPFADLSGVRLREWMGMDEHIFYDARKLAILPMAFCFPGYNERNHDLPPPPDCARLWRRSVFDALPQLEFIVLVGKSALAWHQPSLRSKSLTEVVRGGVIGDDPPILPLPHPSWRNNAWLKANPWFETETLPVLRRKVTQFVR